MNFQQRPNKLQQNSSNNRERSFPAKTFKKHLIHRFSISSHRKRKPKRHLQLHQQQMTKSSLPCEAIFPVNINKYLTHFFSEHIHDGWLQKDEALTLEAEIEQVLSKIKVVSSVDELFNINGGNVISDEYLSQDLRDYLKLISFTETRKYQNFILRREGQSYLLKADGNRQNHSNLFSIGQISNEEADLLLKRQKFIEKIIESQAKYDSSIERLSFISKELAYVYRTYIDNRTFIQNHLSKSYYKLTSLPNTPEQIQSNYLLFFVNKYLKKAFQDSQFDCLNYFQLREHQEKSFSETYQQIESKDQLIQFLERRKPKRGRRNILATACSVCLSDYSELYNPFVSCSGCNLRSHKFCYDLSNRKCGHCLYLRLEKEVKKVIPFCSLCENTGLLPIKISSKLYVHAFCLLIHGFWKIGDSSSLSSNQLDLAEIQAKVTIQEKLNDFLLKKGDRRLLSIDRRKLQKNIIFENPFSNIISAKNNFTTHNKSQAFLSMMEKMDENQIENNMNVTFSERKTFQNKSWFEDMEHKMVNEDLEQIEEESNQSQREQFLCGVCGKVLKKLFYFECSICGLKHHAFCAYFSGFQISLAIDFQYEDSLVKRQAHRIALNCCSVWKQKNSWRRKYKLNYKRFVFLQYKNVENQHEAFADENGGAEESYFP